MCEREELLSFVQVRWRCFVERLAGRHSELGARWKDLRGQVDVADVGVQHLGEAVKPVAVHTTWKLRIEIEDDTAELCKQCSLALHFNQTRNF